MPPGVTEGCCAEGARDSARTAATRATRRLVRCMALSHERKLREPHRIVSLPGPDEGGVARRRVGADPHVVLGVGLEGGAAEERQPREVARQRAPGSVFLAGG